MVSPPLKLVPVNYADESIKEGKGSLLKQFTQGVLFKVGELFRGEFAL